MALSKQSAPIGNLVAFKEFVKRTGGRVSESYPEDAPNKGAHNPKSWHYDTLTHRGVRHSCAVDVNFGPAGTSAAEQAYLRKCAVVAESMGLGVVFARDGKVAAAAQHTTHLHADVGSVTNLGTGGRKNTAGDLDVWNTQPIIHAVRDNLCGPDTEKRLNALREASVYGGEDFPYGVEFTQDVVGTKQDEVWGVKSRAAHDSTMAALQTLWKAEGYYTGRIDKRWGPLMDQARAKFLAKKGR